MSQKRVNFAILPLVNPSFDRELIAIDQIRHISSESLDDCPPEDRALAWLAMLGVYPANPRQWTTLYKDYKTLYFTWVAEQGLSTWHERNILQSIQPEEFGLQNNLLMAVVHGDIVRTGRTIYFLPPAPIETEDPEVLSEPMTPFAGHARRLERVLYMFGRLNRGLGYMQGFNELVVPFYYVLLSARVILNNDIDLVEALSFQCIMALLNGSTLNEFYTTADSSIIMAQLENFRVIYSKHLPAVGKIIDDLEIHPLLFSFRWFNLLFAQEYELPSLLSIWDGILSHFDADNTKLMMRFVFYIALGHLNEVKGRLIPNNYSGTLGLLQNISGIDIKNVLIFANACWAKDFPPPKAAKKKK
jgi:hypothetical protein